MPEPRVLLIEDDPAVRHGMAAFLRANGLDVDEADSCQKAMELCSRGTISVRMPISPPLVRTRGSAGLVACSSLGVMRAVTPRASLLWKP